MPFSQKFEKMFDLYYDESNAIQLDVRENVRFVIVGKKCLSPAKNKKQKEKTLCKDLLQTKEQVSDTNSSEITIIPA